MEDSQWNTMVQALIDQGVVQDEAEAVRRLAAGEKLLFTAKVKSNEWRGLYGTTE